MSPPGIERQRGGGAFEHRHPGALVVPDTPALRQDVLIVGVGHALRIPVVSDVVHLLRPDLQHVQVFLAILPTLEDAVHVHADDLAAVRAGVAVDLIQRRPLLQVHLATVVVVAGPVPVVVTQRVERTLDAADGLVDLFVGGDLLGRLADAVEVEDALDDFLVRDALAPLARCLRRGRDHALGHDAVGRALALLDVSVLPARAAVLLCRRPANPAGLAEEAAALETVGGALVTRNDHAVGVMALDDVGMGAGFVGHPPQVFLALAVLVDEPRLTGAVRLLRRAHMPAFEKTGRQGVGGDPQAALVVGLALLHLGGRHDVIARQPICVALQALRLAEVDLSGSGDVGDRQVAEGFGVVVPEVEHGVRQGLDVGSVALAALGGVFPCLLPHSDSL